MNKPMIITTQTQVKPLLQPWVLPQTETNIQVEIEPLPTLVEKFAPTSLAEMDAVALLNRVDTKFVMPIDQLMEALSAVKSEYRMLEVAGHRLNHYRTLYFDTDWFDLYYLHINHRAEHYKVRSREYLDSNISFLEVKHRTQKNRTIKDRLATDQPITWMNDRAEQWLNGVFPFDSRRLEPRLWNTFTRLTLVNKQQCERVTIDVDLTFTWAQKSVRLDGIAVAEVKLAGLHCQSPFLVQMRKQHIHACGFSKYCVGTAMLYEEVKKNSLKSRLMWIKKVTKGV